MSGLLLVAVSLTTPSVGGPIFFPAESTHDSPIGGHRRDVDAPGNRNKSKAKMQMSRPSSVFSQVQWYRHLPL
ncbi:MAG: hypothetical protein ACYTG5_23145, partial [Planctomycetota bacterium]